MPRKAEAVLGIDAAWTGTEPSGVALIAREGERWRCVRVGPSYGAFCQGDWPSRPQGEPIDVAALLRACQQMMDGCVPTVIAVDMPTSRVEITTRRFADNAVSRAFGHAGCSTHSPDQLRPGRVGRRLLEGFNAAGYPLATTKSPTRSAVIEVYPHVALLGLMNRSQRVPYKASKTTSYWRGETLPRRKRLLLDEWNAISHRLMNEIEGISPPDMKADAPLSSLKAFEDGLDALICAWVGILYLSGECVPLGDEQSAIWVPTRSMAFAKESQSGSR